MEKINMMNHDLSKVNAFNNNQLDDRNFFSNNCSPTSNFYGNWQQQPLAGQKIETSHVLPSGNSADHRSVCESFGDMDSLSDISTEKSDNENDEKSLKKTRKTKSTTKTRDSSLDQKTKSKNREHAKKTRIRKKNYIEALKETVKQFSDERERVDRDHRITLTQLAEQTRLRKQVLQTMFYFRAIAETNPHKWATILDENFTLVLPITPCRSFSPLQVLRGQRIVHGVEGMIKDTASLRVLIQSIGQAKDDGQEVKMQYYSELEDGIMSSNSYMCRWLMKTENAVERGARQEVCKHGMVEAVFSPQNKLYRLEMAFDVMSFMQQLRRSSGRYEFQVVPNTLPLATSDESSDARMIVEAVEPYLITTANQNWCDLMGHRPADVTGARFTIFCGVETEKNLIYSLVRSIEAGEACCHMITGYSKDASKLRLYIRGYPLYTAGFVTHFLFVFEQAFDFPSILICDPSNPLQIINMEATNANHVLNNVSSASASSLTNSKKTTSDHNSSPSEINSDINVSMRMVNSEIKVDSNMNSNYNAQNSSGDCGQLVYSCSMPNSNLRSGDGLPGPSTFTSSESAVTPAANDAQIGLHHCISANDVQNDSSRDANCVNMNGLAVMNSGSSVPYKFAVAACSSSSSSGLKLNAEQQNQKNFFTYPHTKTSAINHDATYSNTIAANRIMSEASSSTATTTHVDKNSRKMFVMHNTAETLDPTTTSYVSNSSHFNNMYGVQETTGFDWTDFLEEDNCYSTAGNNKTMAHNSAIGGISGSGTNKTVIIDWYRK